MSNLKPLPAAVENSYVALLGQLRQARATGDQSRCDALLLSAWQLIPEPRVTYDRAQGTLGAIVSNYRDTGRADEARHWIPTLRTAYGDGVAGKAHVDFIEATVLMELGHLDEAFSLFESLHKQYGRRPFQGTNSKYLKFYQTRKSH